MELNAFFISFIFAIGLIIAGFMGGIAVNLYEDKDRPNDKHEPESKKEPLSSPTPQNDLLNEFIIKSVQEDSMRRLNCRFRPQPQVKIVYMKTSHTSEQDQQKHTEKELKRLLPSLREKE